jgi:hypothetical protein
VELLEECEFWARDGMDACLELVLVMTREGVYRDVEAARLVLDLKTIAKQLAHPGVLRDGGEALIQEVLETEVVSAHDELARPEVGMPMVHRLDEPDELALVGHQLGVLRGDLAAEERDRAPVLVNHRAKASDRGVTVDQSAQQSSAIGGPASP